MISVNTSLTRCIQEHVVYQYKSRFVTVCRLRISEEVAKGTGRGTAIECGVASVRGTLVGYSVHHQCYDQTCMKHVIASGVTWNQLVPPSLRY